MSKSFVKKLGLKSPIIQAPMAGVVTAKMVAEVCKSGGLGSLPVSHIDFRLPEEFQQLQGLVERTRGLIGDCSIENNINLNFFCHTISPSVTDSRVGNWFELYEKTTNVGINRGEITFKNINVSFKEYEGKKAFHDLLSFFENKFLPKVVSFHFGCPSKLSMKSLQSLGILVFVSATSIDEVLLLNELGVDGIICQGYEAGGHRGNFLQTDPRLDEKLSTSCLVKRAIHSIKSSKRSETFIIPAGGIGTSTDIQYYLSLGASAVQIGSAFLATPESKACQTFRDLLSEKNSQNSTIMTELISGKPARAILTPFLKALILHYSGEDLPPYPYMYDAFKKLKNQYSEANFLLAGEAYLSMEKGLGTAQVLKLLMEGLAETD